MHLSETIIAVLVIAAVVGQFVFIAWRRHKTFFNAKHSAKKRSELIEREFDKQTGGGK